MFIYKNIRSDDMYLKIDGGLTFTAPARDIELVEVQGRDGDILIDNGRYRSVNHAIPCRLVLPQGENLEMATTRIHDWLSTDTNYHDFVWSGDPDFTYKALVYEEYETQRVLHRYGRTVLKFRFHPIKYLTSSLEERPISNEEIIYNPYQIAAKPLIKLIGTGDMSIHIGDQKLDLRSVDRGINIDSETQTVTSFDGQRTEFDKMFSYPFPVLQRGDNSITFGENVEAMHVTARLGALIS